MSDCGEIKLERKIDKIVAYTMIILIMICAGASLAVSTISLAMLITGSPLEIYQIISFILTGIFMLFLISVSFGKRSA